MRKIRIAALSLCFILLFGNVVLAATSVNKVEPNSLAMRR